MIKKIEIFYALIRKTNFVFTLLFLFILLSPFSLWDKHIIPNQIEIIGFSFLVSNILFTFILIQGIFRSKGKIKITALDLIFLIYFIYLLLLLLLFPERTLIESKVKLLTTVLFYVIFRISKLKHYNYLFFIIIFSGIINLAYETIYQIKNLYPGQNFFNIKGVFLNTGTWGEFMSILFILSIGFAYYYSTHRIKSIKITFLSIGLIFSLFLVASNSRAAWMGTILSIAYLLFIIQKQNLVRLNIKYKLTLILSFSILILSILIGLYKYKRASADGRLLIWQVSAQMVKDKPIWGFGIDGFKTNYMNYQADYFFDNTESSFASLAGNNQFVFNEFIKIWIEQGLLGLILFLLIIESSLKTYKI